MNWILQIYIFIRSLLYFIAQLWKDWKMKNIQTSLFFRRFLLDKSPISIIEKYVLKNFIHNLLHARGCAIPLEKCQGTLSGLALSQNISSKYKYMYVCCHSQLLLSYVSCICIYVCVSYYRSRLGIQRFQLDPGVYVSAILPNLLCNCHC